MKRIVRKIYLIIILSALILPVYTQQISKGQINIPAELIQRGDSMHLNMNINLNNYNISSNRWMMLTPVLTNPMGNEEIILPQVLINGKNRNRVFRRGIELKKDIDISNLYTVVKDGQQDIIVYYKKSVPYAPWMKNAQIKMEQELCGCGGHKQEIMTDILIPTIIMENTDIMPPVIQPDKPLHYKDTLGIYIEFPVGKSIIHNDFRRNASELSKLKEGIERILNQRNSIKDIEIVGYASPEGPIAFNRSLSQRRAEALKNYIMEKYPELNSNMFNLSYEGEGWKELEELVKSSDITNKEEILSIIRNTPDINLRKQKIKAINNGTTYKKMLNDLYPQIRKATFHLYFTIGN